MFPGQTCNRETCRNAYGISKGNVERWVAVVRPGKILFELSYGDENVAREAIDRAIQKLPIKAKFVTRREGF